MPYATNGDVQLYFETFGATSDPALLLINGLGSQCINYRAQWCERFAAEGLHVIRFDNRDVGLSTKFDTAGAGEGTGAVYTVRDKARYAIDHREHL